MEKHPHLKERLLADEGIKFMHKDSTVACTVIAQLTEARIPALCIHDSFIVASQHRERLQAKINRAATRVFGGALKTETTTGLRCHDPVYDGAQPAPNQLIVTESYRRRLATWRQRQEVEALEEEFY